MHVNHCVVHCSTCQLLCASQNDEVDREVQSAWGFRSTCVVYIPTRQPLRGLHVFPLNLQHLSGTNTVNGPKCTT